ncbi:FAD-binding oxidoreductase [Ralstonia syzygii]|uniref:FAD-binding oxidoreductase n=1 Tax=Ralstonia syzygii TaxID=28097 RepID=UPI0036F28A1F
MRPKTAEEVAGVVAYCRDHRIRIVPQGGNTSMVGGAVPDDTNSTIVLNLGRMNQVVEVDVLNDTMTVQAGCTLAQAREAAEAAGRLFPLRIGSDGSCQIGGNLSTNAGGTAVLKYGNMRELTLGLEVVLPDGRIWPGLKGLRKDNTGYDLKHLFIGAEGTLGIITAAVLKLAPLPTARSVAMVRVHDIRAAIELLSLAKECAGQAVNAFELISPDAMVLVLEHLSLAQGPLGNAHGWQVLIELTSNGAQHGLDETLLALLETGAERGLVEDAAIAASQAQIEHMWKIREEISDAQTRTGGGVRCDVSVPISSMALFIEQASERVRSIAPDVRMIIYGHVGDGNVHFNPLRPKSRDAKEFVQATSVAITEAVDGLAMFLKGSISAEHGVGVGKRDELLAWKSAVELELMWSIKRALDPHGLMNPGKVLPSLPST